MSADTWGAATVTALAVAMLAARMATRVPAARVPGADRADTGRRRLTFQVVRRSTQPGADEVADWCDAVARSLRSGSSLTAAIVAGAAIDSAMADVVAPVVQQVRRGESLVDALDHDSVDPVSAAGLALTVLRSCARFGGPAAAPLERAAVTLRARAAVAAEQQAQSAQARLSARVLTFVPVALLVLLAATDQKVRSAITTPAGVAVVSLGGLLNATGALWMRRIIGRPR
jgi:tight adherence protein B